MTNTTTAKAIAVLAITIALAGCSAADQQQSPAESATTSQTPQPSQTPTPTGPTADELIAELAGQKGELSPELATGLAGFTSTEIAAALDNQWKAATTQALQQASTWYDDFCSAKQDADQTVLRTIYLSGAIRYGSAECPKALEKQLGGTSVYLDAWVALGTGMRQDAGKTPDVSQIPLPDALGKGKAPKLAKSPKPGGKEATGKFLVIKRESWGDKPTDNTSYIGDPANLATNADDLAKIILITNTYKKVAGGNTKIYQCKTSIYGIDPASKKYFAKKTLDGTKTDPTGSLPIGDTFYFACPNAEKAVLDLQN
jgi:hypothetical protein